MIRFQHVTQAASLIVFVVLLALAAHPFPHGMAVDFFLRLDPLLVTATALAGRETAPYLLPGLLVLGATFVFGRFFCGHICPMGTTIDVLQGRLVRKRRRSAVASSYEANKRHRTWKYLILGAILAAAAAGVSLVHAGSPLSLVTRFYGLVLYPLTLLIADAGLEFGSVLMPSSSIAYAQVTQKVFAANIFFLALMLGIVFLAVYQPRFWCRHLCPAGGLMGLISRWSRVKRRVSESCTRCGRCQRECPVSAITKEPQGTAGAECIMCLRCRDVCPVSAVSFGFERGSLPTEAVPAPDLTRRGIVLALGSGLLSAGLFRTSINQQRLLGSEKPLLDEGLVRPPGALPEPDLLTRCVRCGECMKACPTNTLQPVWLKAGLEGIFSPAMTTRLAACATNCNTCGQVCPTGAIRNLPLIEKNHAKVGTAWVVRQNCLVWEQDKKCLVCDEVCPYNALSFQPVPGLRNAAPFVLENRCTGCGWCETKCPVEGASAIRVNVIGQVRLASGSYVEKAREYGFVFKARSDELDRLAPGTFDAPVSPGGEGPLQAPPREQKESLPPGFLPK